MTLVRPPKRNSAADLAALRAVAQPTRRTGQWASGSMALCAMLASLVVASSASAVILTGGPVDVLPGGGGCTLSGVASQSGGTTVSCTGINLAAHTKVYFGVRNDANVNGNTMTGSAPGSGSGAVFRFASSGASSITYTSTTTITDVLNGSQIVTNQLVLTRTGGSANVVSAAGNPANNANGDIQALFQITAGGGFTVRVDVQAGPGNACPALYDPTHTPASGTSDFSKVDVGFYFSDCGDGVIDSPEQCDAAGANGSPSSCCTSTCTLRPTSFICRPGAGPPCDNSETCTGISAVCPPDDAPVNMGMVCRGGSGDVCDQNELCTGVPGAGCPADDAPGNTTIVCRAGSVGDLCDAPENCSGVPGATCPPDDAPGHINMVCRPGSGDVCDPAEQCSGIPGQFCPPDVVSNPSTLCRTGSGDSCDPNELCTAIPGQPCPSDVVAPSGTVCRAAAGQCDVAETCNGTAGQPCPADAFQPSSTACYNDSSVCTIDKCNGSGTCVFNSNLNCADSNTCTQDSCDPDDGCVYSGQPSNSCIAAAKGKLKIKDNVDDNKDSIKFLWKGGPSLISTMGNPTMSTSYELCVYDNGGVRMAMSVPPGMGWALIGSPSSPKGYKYIDISASQDGTKLIKTKASSLNKAKLKWIGKGGFLPDNPMLPFQFPVTAQLYASNGACWQAQFSMNQASRNNDSGFTASAP